MKYLQPSFTVPAAPEKVTACEACVYGRGLHSEWCPVFNAMVKLRAAVDRIPGGAFARYA